MPETDSNEPKPKMPRWALWVAKQISGLNFIMKGLIVFVATATLLVAAVSKVEWPFGGPNCSDYTKLNGKDLQICLNREK